MACWFAGSRLCRFSEQIVFGLISLYFLAVPYSDRAGADWMNLTGAETAPNIAEITVLDDRVRVAIEIYIGNLSTFKDLVPDDFLKKEAVRNRLPLDQRLKRFSAQTFQVLANDGTNLSADLKLAEPRLRKDRYSPFAGMIDPRTRRRVPEAPKDKRVLYVEIDYPFEGKPETLTFIPPRDKNGILAVSIGFIAYHKAVPIIDFRYLSAASKLTLDWADPWYSKFDNPNLKRHHKSALMAFLYVEPREVRHEVLIRVRDLQEWTDLGLSSGPTISLDEQTMIKERARSFFAGRNPLKVDGIAALPDSTRAEFLNISLTGLRILEDEKPLDLSTAILGIILSYPVKSLPKSVSVQWDLFNERVKRIPATSIDPAGPFPTYIDVRDPKFEWKNFLRTYEEPRVSPVTHDGGRSISVPLASVVLFAVALVSVGFAARPTRLSRPAWIAFSVLSTIAGLLLLRVAVIDVMNPFAGPPDEKTAQQIAVRILENVNTAYLEKDPAQLQQALEVVVDDDALSDVKAELGRALAIKVAGGGIARVNEINNLALKDITALEGRDGFRSLAQWTAKASAGHWGHVHRRTISFRALLELIQVAGSWKIAGITVVDAKRQAGPVQ